MTLAALVAVVGAMLLVRIGWSGVNGAAGGGWAAAAGALAVLLGREGVWGVAVGIAAGIVAALLMILQAGWTSPVRVMRPARVAATVTLPRAPLDLARRLAVFVLVVPGAFAGAMALAFGVQAVARRAGAAEADAIVLMLMIQLVVWTCLMAVQMMQASLARMLALPIIAALLGLALWWVS